MKKITFTLFALMLCSIGYVAAQALDTIPNSTFTRWNPGWQTKPKAVPQGWDTVSGTSYPVSSVLYVRNGQSHTVPDYDGPNALSLSMGVYGSSLHIGEIYCKLPLHHLDPYLNLNMAYFGGGQQTCFIRFVAFRHSATPTSGDTAISVGYYPSNGTSALDTLLPWSVLSLPLNVKNTITPDSAYIILYNSFFLTVPPANSSTELYLAHIWFSNTQVTTGVDPVEVSKGVTAQVYPNPFSGKTTIHYTLGQSSNVSLVIYDMQGREVKTLVNGNQSAGAYNETFDANGLDNGVYMYRLQTSSGVQTGKLILSK